MAWEGGGGRSNGTASSGHITGQFSRRRHLRQQRTSLHKQIMLMASDNQNKKREVDKLHLCIRSECIRSGLVVKQQTGSPELHRFTLQHQGPIHILDPQPVNRV
jgi:hypothetical protein